MPHHFAYGLFHSLRAATLHINASSMRQERDGKKAGVLKRVFFETFGTVHLLKDSDLVIFRRMLWSFSTWGQGEGSEKEYNTFVSPTPAFFRWIDRKQASPLLTRVHA